MNIDIERLKTDPDYWDEVGAPVDATHWVGPASNPWEIHNESGRLIWYINGWIAGDYRYLVDHDYCIPRPTNKQWDGTGLPPVGVECEYHLGASLNWFKCKIIMHVGSQGVVMEADVFEGMQYCSFNGNQAVEFRPIKSPRERAIEAGIYEAKKLNPDLTVSDAALLKSYTASLIDAGWQPPEDSK